MKTRYCVWLPFGELLHHETDVSGPVFRRCPGNPDWWKERADILAEYTIPSLLNQKVQFEIWAGIAEETRDICRPALDVLERAGTHVVFHPARDAEKYGKGVAREAIMEALDGYDAVMFAQLDADDMYVDDALAAMAVHKPEEGLVLLFRNGYYLNAATGEMQTCSPGPCPPPFFGRVYTKAYCDDPDGYEKEWVYCVTHPSLLKSKKRVDLPDGKYVFVCHERNTTSSWERVKKGNRLKRLVEGEEKAEVLRRCGR